MAPFHARFCYLFTLVRMGKVIIDFSEHLFVRIKEFSFFALFEKLQVPLCPFAKHEPPARGNFDTSACHFIPVYFPQETKVNFGCANRFGIIFGEKMLVLYVEVSVLVDPW